MATAGALRYRRVLLKLSGEALMGSASFGIDPEVVRDSVGRAGRRSTRCGVELALVVGGGNIFRGVKAASAGMDRVSGDHMGMLATLINSLGAPGSARAARRPDARALRDRDPAGRRAVHPAAGDPPPREGARHHPGRGTGNPYFTTDSAAALRAMEVKAEVLLKATKVDGIYNADPMSNPAAKMIPRITYREVLERGLKVMDATAISLCMDNKLPIVVFNIRQDGNIRRVIHGEPIGSVVSE